MMQYLVILLDDTSVSYCHCDNPNKERRLIDLDTLRRGIRYAMTENLMVQFVYPDYVLPQEYLDMIDTIDHHDIVPASLGAKGDVVVVDGMDKMPTSLEIFGDEAVYVLRLEKTDVLNGTADIANLLHTVARVNIVVKDINTFSDEEAARYAQTLAMWSKAVEAEYRQGRTPQLNLLTDRIMLEKANHCEAGVGNITLAPNGQFYLCPAFYYDNLADSVGNLDSGLNIKNQQLLRLDHAPICRHCDAWHCRRCVWMNRRGTLELNTPTHGQCIVTHAEREASRQMLNRLKGENVIVSDTEIKELSYNDPFDKRKEWE